MLYIWFICWNRDTHSHLTHKVEHLTLENFLSRAAWVPKHKPQVHDPRKETGIWKVSKTFVSHSGEGVKQVAFILEIRSQSWHPYTASIFPPQASLTRQNRDIALTIFIGIWLLYNAVSLCCWVKWISYTCACIPSVLDFLLIYITVDHRAEFPVLYSRFSLVLFYTQYT